MKAKQKKQAKVPTLLEAIEKVATLSEDSKMSDEFMNATSLEITLLAKSYDITERQAVIFCICMEKGPRNVDFRDIASHLDISRIAALCYATDIDALVRRRLLRYRDVKDEDSFDIPIPVIRMLKHNEVYQPPKQTGLDCGEMFELLENWFEDLDNDAVSPAELSEQLERLFDDNQQVCFARKMKELRLDDTDLLLLTLFCHLFINEDDDSICFRQIRDAFQSSADFNRTKAEMRVGESTLMRRKLIEHSCDNGIADTSRFKLTEEAKRTLLAEMNISAHEEKLADVKRPEELTAKQLFFTEGIQRKVDELQALLQQDAFAQIRQRMEDRGFRQAFTCLFYGGPGTGKTESVYQLAKKTGRAVMMVDVPQIKSKWVGDSEKNVKALFDRYRELVKREKTTPILLFNEADAIIGIRKNGAESAVDKMENSIQNIILQEMETIDGIMIATTNLQQNFDKAFERRFLYKIQFEKPDEAVRQQIWQQMIPEITSSEVISLANYDFSGGQIENVARKYAISVILKGDDEAGRLGTLLGYCDDELLNNKATRKIGF